MLRIDVRTCLFLWCVGAGCTDFTDPVAVECNPEDGCRAGRICHDGQCKAPSWHMEWPMCFTGRGFFNGGEGYEVNIWLSANGDASVGYVEGWYGHGFHPHRDDEEFRRTIPGQWTGTEDSFSIHGLMHCVEGLRVTQWSEETVWVCEMLEPPGDPRGVERPFDVRMCGDTVVVEF